MPYGEIRVDTITFTNGGVDTSITVSGLAASTTGNLTVTGTISGATVRATTVSGVTVTGTTVQGASGTFTSITGGVATITSGVFTAGSAAAPSISFSSDPNTGIYSPGADQVAISTSGTGRLFVDASGVVSVGTQTAGAGTTALAAIFATSTGVGGVVHVRKSNDGANAPNIQFQKSRGSLSAPTAVLQGDNLASIAGFGYDGTTFRNAGEVLIAADSAASADNLAGYVTISTRPSGAAQSAQERLRITSTGLVGIGTSAPGVTLDVSGIARVASGNDAGSLLFKHTTASANSRSWRAINDVTAYGDFAIQQSTTQTGDTYASRLYINASGNVGIGTSAPADKLSVYTASATDTVIGIGNTAGNGWAGYLTSGGDLLYGLQTSGNVTLRTNNQERLRITSAGLVGIGTSAPSYALDVVSSDTTAGIGYALRLRHNATAGASAIQFTDNGATTQHGYIACDSSSNLKFGTGLTEKARITSAGLVGIGTSAPTGILHVRSAATTAGWQLRLDSVGLSNESGFYRDASDNYEMVLRNGAGGLSYIKNNGGASTANLAFFAQGSERAQIDSSGRLLVGTSTARSNFLAGGASALVQIERAGEGTAEFSAVRNANSTSGGLLILGKSRSAAVGGVTTITNNDQMGWISFQGADGTNLVEGASIRGEVDGTPGANDMPGRLVFSTTADGASSPTERWRISCTGQIFQYSNQYNFSNSASTIEFVNRDAGGAKTFQWYVGASGGSPVATLSTAGVWTNASDARYKENIQDISYGIDIVKQLKPRSFDIISTGASAIGFVAQELKESVPEVIHEVPAHDGETYLNVDYGSLTAVLTKALQEAVARIEQLETAVATLQGS